MHVIQSSELYLSDGAVGLQQEGLDFWLIRFDLLFVKSATTMQTEVNLI
jgi:hypothetical protein